MTSSGSPAPGPSDRSRDHYSASGNYTLPKLVKGGNKMDIFNKKFEKKAKTLKNRILEKSDRQHENMIRNKFLCIVGWKAWKTNNEIQQ
jgi:hypothetical protein